VQVASPLADLVHEARSWRRGPVAGFHSRFILYARTAINGLPASSTCWQTGCHRLSSVSVVLIRHFYPAGDQLSNCGVSGLQYSELISEGRIKKCRRDNNLRASRPQLYPARAGFQVCGCGLHYVKAHLTCAARNSPSSLVS
jgi:hypothetical protein